jgi:uncharacterized protein YcfJ
MRKYAFVAAICVGTAACTPTTTGTVAGATTGAIVGGPVGAVVGGGVGAAAGATTGAIAGTQVAGPVPGRCYVYDTAGNLVRRRSGTPVTTRC